MSASDDRVGLPIYLPHLAQQPSLCLLTSYAAKLNVSKGLDRKVQVYSADSRFSHVYIRLGKIADAKNATLEIVDAGKHSFRLIMYGFLNKEESANHAQQISNALGCKIEKEPRGGARIIYDLGPSISGKNGTESEGCNSSGLQLPKLLREIKKPMPENKIMQYDYNTRTRKSYVSHKVNIPEGIKQNLSLLQNLVSGIDGVSSVEIVADNKKESGLKCTGRIVDAGIESKMIISFSPSLDRLTLMKVGESQVTYKFCGDSLKKFEDVFLPLGYKRESELMWRKTSGDDLNSPKMASIEEKVCLEKKSSSIEDESRSGKIFGYIAESKKSIIDEALKKSKQDSLKDSVPQENYRYELESITRIVGSSADLVPKKWDPHLQGAVYEYDAIIKKIPVVITRTPDGSGYILRPLNEKHDDYISEISDVLDGMNLSKVAKRDGNNPRWIRRKGKIS